MGKSFHLTCMDPESLPSPGQRNPCMGLGRLRFHQIFQGALPFSPDLPIKVKNWCNKILPGRTGHIKLHGYEGGQEQKLKHRYV